MIKKKRETLFESIHEEFQGMVSQICLGFLKGDHQQAQDLSQEVFVNAWNALDRFRAESSYKTWIYRITVNTCLKFIRDRKDTVRLSDETEPMEIESSESDEQTQLLYRAIGMLNEVDRLIIMFVLEELPYDEIAEVIGINEGNLRVKIHRIKNNLKTILSNE